MPTLSDAYMFMMTTANPLATEGQDQVSIFVTAIISSAVLAAVVSGVVQYIVNRRNSRVTERKNTFDAESDLVVRYKEAAAEERVQKESAVKTVRDILTLSEDQVLSLKSTITILHNTIEVMTQVAHTQQEVIDQLTSDRDSTAEKLKIALEQINFQKNELERYQEEIKALMPRED